MDTELETPTDAGAVDDGPDLIVRTYAAEMTAGDGRTVDVRIVPYGERITHNDGLGGVPKGVPYQEEWLPGVFDHQLNAAHRVVANVEHEQGIGGMVARGVSFREGRDGFYGSFKMLGTQNADAALELVKEGVFDGVSLEAKPAKNGSIRSAAGVVQRAKANLFAIAFTRFAAYQGARVLAVREEADPIDENLLPVNADPELIERCRRLGVRLPQRYDAQPAETDTPAEPGTSEDGTRVATQTPSEEE
jgi:HK97 family phage prohead protease